MAAISKWRNTKWGWNSKMASKSNMAAIMKCQLIQENAIITWRQSQGNSYNTDWYKLTSTRLEQGFYDIPGSVIQQAKRRLHFCTKKIFHMASRKMIPTLIPIRHYQITETILNYREILIVRANNLLLRESTNGAIMPRTSGLSGPSHANGQDRKPARKTMISAPLSL